MAMLAEKRRKTKFVLQPNIKPLWTAETSGKRMMEKMGWSAGKGLGANEQGISEPVRAVFKQDTKGVGFKGDGNPFHNQDEFNAILANLAATKQTDSEVPLTFESLEEKSKKSKTRVHYKKFTRGKDLSRYSSTDLACIVGNGKKEDEELEEIAEVNVYAPGETENAFGVTTVHGGSIADYFKSKWKTCNRENESREVRTQDEELMLNEFRTSENDEQGSLKTKYEDFGNSMKEETEAIEYNFVKDECEGNEHSKAAGRHMKKKKRHDRKTNRENEDCNNDINPLNNLSIKSVNDRESKAHSDELNLEENIPDGSKRNNSGKFSQVPALTPCENELNENQCGEIADIEMEINDERIKKKKKRRKTEVHVPDEQYSHQTECLPILQEHCNSKLYENQLGEIEEGEREIHEKRTKKKKKISKTDDVPEEQHSKPNDSYLILQDDCERKLMRNQSEEIDVVEINQKKRKKKRKRSRTEDDCTIEEQNQSLPLPQVGYERHGEYSAIDKDTGQRSLDLDINSDIQLGTRSDDGAIPKKSKKDKKKREQRSYLLEHNASLEISNKRTKKKNAKSEVTMNEASVLDPIVEDETSEEIIKNVDENMEVTVDLVNPQNDARQKSKRKLKSSSINDKNESENQELIQDNQRIRKVARKFPGSSLDQLPGYGVKTN